MSKITEISSDVQKARSEALEAARSQIDKQFGKGSLMKLGDAQGTLDVEVIPSGSLLLDEALGVGGYPKGRIIEIYGPESSGKTTLALHAIAESQKLGGIAAFIDAEHALDPTYAKNLGVNINELWISQPDNGEQALEITESLVRSGAVDIIVVDSVAALTRHSCKEQHNDHFHKPAENENRRHVRQPRDNHRRKCAEILRFHKNGCQEGRIHRQEPG